jgi:hypothetical protein
MSDPSAFVRTRPRPQISPANGPPGTGGGVAKTSKKHVSDAGRQRLSELAKQRHQAGGFQATAKGKSKKRKPSRERVAQMVAEAALEKRTAEAIINVFRDAISEAQPITVRLKAAEAWIGVEREEGKLQAKEAQVASEHMDREAALAFLSQKLTSGHAASLLRQRLELPPPEAVQFDFNTINGTAEEISDEHRAA